MGDLRCRRARRPLPAAEVVKVRPGDGRGSRHIAVLALRHDREVFKAGVAAARTGGVRALEVGLLVVRGRDARSRGQRRRNRGHRRRCWRRG